VIAGGGSRPWFRENTAVLGEMLPAARALTVNGWDHLAPLTRAGELARITADFIDSCVGLTPQGRTS
jgi:hypothetical protein